MEIEVLNNKISDTKAIVEKLDLNNDPLFINAISEVEIEYSGLQINYNNEHSIILNKIHTHNMSRKLFDIVHRALGYYALVDQAIGTNETPIGKVKAQEILENLAKGEIDLSETKDQLYLQINSKTI
jgi:hypothetical protein